MNQGWSVVAVMCAFAAMVAPVARAQMVEPAPVVTVAPSGSTEHPRGYPDVAMAADGTTAVVWEDTDADAHWESPRVRLQRFDRRSKALGDAVAVGPDAATFVPAVAMAPDGRFVVAYVRRFRDDPRNPGYRVEVQRFSATGMPEGAAILPGGDAGEDFDDLPPALVVGEDGRFAIAWVAFTPDGSNERSIAVRMYRADGTPVAEPAIVAPALSYKMHPSLALTPDGGLLATWRPRGVTGVPVVLAGRRIGPDGAPAGDPLTLWTDPPAVDALNPVLASNAAGDTFLTFTAPGRDGGLFVMGGSFDALGASLDPVVRLADTGWYSASDAAVDRAGQVLVAYEAADGDQDRAFLRELGRDGAAAGAPVPVAEATRAELRPVVAIDGAGRAAVAYALPGPNNESKIMLRRFNYGDVDDGPPRTEPLTPDPGPGAVPLPAGPTAAASGPATTTPPHACTSRRHFTINLPVSGKAAVVRVNGRRVAVRRGARRLEIDLRGRPAQSVTVTIRWLRRDGRHSVLTRRYRTCAA